MLDFGSRLRRLRPEWWQFNLSYEELISRLNEVKKEFGMRRALSRRSLHGETRTFAEILDQDVEKIVLFYLRYQGELATRLWAMRERQIMKMQEVTLSIEQIETLWQRYRDLSQVGF
jgi:SPX domain protein involved in polyphosphate accumulation